MPKSVRVQSVSEGEPDNQPAVSAGDQETSNISALEKWRGGPRAWVQWEVYGEHSVGRVTLQTFYSRNLDVRKLLESFLGLIPRIQDENSPG